MIEYAAVICSFVFAMIGMVCGIWACIQVIAMQKSTHQVTFFDPKNQKFEELPVQAPEQQAPVNDEVDFDNI